MRLPAAWRPMVPWAIATVLCAPLVLSILVFSLLGELYTELPSELGGYVKHLDRDFVPPPDEAPEDANVLRGIVFATSGLACAVSGPKRLPGARVELTVVSEISANLLQFSLLVDPAIAAQPDFVIVQSALLVAMTWNASPSAVDAAWFFWRGQILALMPHRVRSDTRQRVMPFLRCDPKILPMEQWQDGLKRLGRSISPLVDRPLDQTRAILLRFVEAGIPVLVVTPPSNEFSEARSARVSEGARSTVGPGADAAAVHFLEPQKLWPNEQFADPLHIDPNRNESYRAWLSAAIVATLGD